ncbi:Helitron helicase [Phytophthora megakarya]|uniref:Helitron helicase n=1 Tax=Phytophthora megakarya TaxID=4795 RepID=A0A225WYB7_9STRA|nr:Helitron helicase [Phytophthora megakarya]
MPPTFTGGPRYMYQRFLDGMAIVRETGPPNLFITMTCNPNRPEIDLDEDLLGVVAAKVHVVEYQKRGLPHAHTLLIMRPEDKPVSAEDVDRLVSAELPDKEKHPELYETVVSNMLHGPCGQQNHNCPSMKNGKCSKKFPKVFADGTVTAEDKILRICVASTLKELLSIKERCAIMPR